MENKLTYKHKKCVLYHTALEMYLPMPSVNVSEMAEPFDKGLTKIKPNKLLSATLGLRGLKIKWIIKAQNVKKYHGRNEAMMSWSSVEKYC